VTRPRPSISPALAGAVDLSGLKQRAQAPAGSAAPAGGVEITEANFEAEVLVRSGQLPVVVVLWSPRSEVCVELIDAFAAVALASARELGVAPGTVNRNGGAIAVGRATGM
jgi:putative thioredoxin